MLETLNAFLWGPGTLALILGTGAWLTLRTGGFPQRNLGQALALSLERDARRKGVNGVSPFGSLMTALATTVGTGNIVGVAAALVSGGPGALVWMELAAALGLAVKFAECMLAVKYRRIRSDGTRWGGPMAVMEARLGRPGNPLGKLYAFFALLMAFAMGAMAQSGALADTCAAAFSLSRRQVGVTAAALALTILLGGIRRIADVSTLLVPVMALLYIGGGAAVILGNLPRLPDALTLMLRCAFAPEAALVFENAIERLFYTQEYRIGKAVLPQANVRSRLWDLDSTILQSVEGKLRQNQRTVKNSTAYTMAVIFNAICESQSDLLLDPYLNSIGGYPGDGA